MSINNNELTVLLLLFLQLLMVLHHRITKCTLRLQPVCMDMLKELAPKIAIWT